MTCQSLVLFHYYFIIHVETECKNPLETYFGFIKFFKEECTCLWRSLCCHLSCSFWVPIFSNNMLVIRYKHWVNFSPVSLRIILANELSRMIAGCLFMFQGPCTGNQQSLAHSRLWDAVVGFLHVFAHMQMKLSQVS